jgi:hypothetical protein
MIKMGPVSFGAALIEAAKSLNGSLDVTFFESWSIGRQFCELGHRTTCFTSWDTGRHVFRVGTPELDFGSNEIMRPNEIARVCLKFSCIVVARTSTSKFRFAQPP